MTREEANRLLHAYIDGELDPAKTLELEAHLAENPSVRAACERLRGMSAAIRDKADYHAAPAWLEARVGALREESQHARGRAEMDCGEGPPERQGSNAIEPERENSQRSDWRWSPVSAAMATRWRPLPRTSPACQAEVASCWVGDLHVSATPADSPTGRNRQRKY